MAAKLPSHFVTAILPRAIQRLLKSVGENRVLIIGGAGYIGSILVRKLLAQGRKVRVLDSMVYGDRALRGVMSHPNFELMIGDCRHIQHVIRAVKDTDAIVLLAPKRADDIKLKAALQPLLGKIDIADMRAANLRAAGNDANSSPDAVARWLSEKVGK